MIFEVTKEEIRKLDDSSLRELIRRLCRAEADDCGCGAVAVYCGGDQNATDGGIDVDVNLGEESLLRGQLRKGHTIIQVKKPSMPPAKIREEMRPKGMLRSIFTSLAREHGSYIIASSGDDCSPLARENRIGAMKKALDTLADRVYPDFWDLSSMVAWCNQYPAVICWVKYMSGLEIEGWQPYGDWSESHIPSAAYLVDDEARIYTQGEIAPLKILDGLDSIRTILRRRGSSVRLIGLSGVGKTRFAQAIFEEGVGEDPLSSEKVLYLNRQNSFKISPTDMIEILLCAEEDAVVVVDNCSSEEHHLLTQKITRPNSTISLLTIEYDVQEDEPEDSSVYKMFPSSDKCICQLLRQRFPDWTDESYQRISKLAGGNARIAIVLAKAVLQAGELSELRDKELFARLFWQNGQYDPELERTAQVCSLVYSFSVDIESDTEGINELSCLAGLAGLSVNDIYRNVCRLERKQLVQERGVWRAILPHALANHLAAEALEEVPKKALLTQMEQSTWHMQRSFSKRLSYLHNSTSAQNIFRGWLTVPPMQNPSSWNEVCQYRLEDAAPVIPNEVLSYIENICEKRLWPEQLKERFDVYTLRRILFQLAYEMEYFERSVMLLISIAQQIGDGENGARLFQMEYSGTKTPLEMRLSVIRKLLLDSLPEHTMIAVEYLEASMKSSWNYEISNPFMYEFGARQRDDGWSPNTHKEAIVWYKAVIDFIQEKFPCLPEDVKSSIDKKVAGSLRGLWISGYIDVVEYCCYYISRERSWWRGWVNLGEIKEYDEKEMPDEDIARLLQLLNLTEPKKLVERTVCLLSADRFSLDPFFAIEEDDFESMELISELRHLGEEISKKPDSLAIILDSIDCANYDAKYFGEVLAEREAKPGSMWQILKCYLSKRNIASIQLGYLKFHYSNDSAMVLAWLQEAESTETLQQVISLWSGLDKSKQFFEHMQELLFSGELGIEAIESLLCSLASFSVEESDVLTFFDKLLGVDGGLETVTNLLAIYCYDKYKSRKKATLPLTLQAYVRSICIKCMYEDHMTSRYLYEFEYAIASSFGATATIFEVQDFFFAVLKLFKCGYGHIYDISSFKRRVIVPVAQAHSVEFLDIIYEANSTPVSRILVGDRENDINILDNLAIESIMMWANSSEKRLFLAEVCRPFRPGSQGWSEIADRLLHSEDGIFVLRVFKKKIQPNIWSGSLYEILEKRMLLFQNLRTDPILGCEIRKLLPTFNETMRRVKEREQSQEDQQKYQQFEY